MQIHETWQRRINRVGVNHSIHSDSSMHGTNNNKMSDVGVSYTHCLFVSRVGSSSSPWVFHFPTTTAITPSYNSSNNALLTKRQCKYANSIKEIDSRRDTMQNLAPVPESEERIATLWKIVVPYETIFINCNQLSCLYPRVPTINISIIQ